MLTRFHRYSFSAFLGDTIAQQTSCSSDSSSFFCISFAWPLRPGYRSCTADVGPGTQSAFYFHVTCVLLPSSAPLHLFSWSFFQIFRLYTHLYAQMYVLQSRIWIWAWTCGFCFSEFGSTCFIAIHFPANFMSSSFFLAEQNPIVWSYHTSIICSLVGGHPGWC